MNPTKSWQVPLYASTLFLAAMLLFGLQPMLVRMILPAMGGAPAVWTTAQVFFQALLLVGYLYAHLLARIPNIQKALLVHLLVLGVALLLVPISLPAQWQPDIDGAPALALLEALTVTVGLPFFAIATTAPLLQHWFSVSDHAQASSPYFLYSASNLGGLAALVSYPFLVEPLLGLHAQSTTWAYGFALLAILVVIVGATLVRSTRTAPSTDIAAASGSAHPPEPAPLPITAAQRLRWTMLAFVPSSLMLAVTLHVSTDIAAIPFLWLLPLALYLLSWVITFARSPALSHHTVLRVQPFALVLLVLAFDTKHLALAFLIHLGAFFVNAMMCHGELARTRPSAQQLTEFYLWISLGGFLGGVFNAILAPLLFNAIFEYPIALVLAALLRPSSLKHQSSRRTRVLRDVSLAITLALFYLAAQWALSALTWADTTFALVAVACGIGILFCTMREHRLRFTLAAAALLIAAQITTDDSQVLVQARSFFGVHRLLADATGRYIMMTHGNTVHGLQRRVDLGPPVPLAYYIESGPVGRVLQRLNENAPRANIGLVGMGSAAISCLANSTQQLTYFEIDPIVIELANDARFLRFMKYCGANSKVVLGDGRRRLEREPDRHFDMLVLDAFSSDAIPIHLLTREALQIYTRKLAADGVMVVHLSNRHLDLIPVVAATALSAGLTYRVQPSAPAARTYENWPSTWMLIGRQLAALQPFLDTGPWHASPSAADPWTDDYSNIAAAIRWDSLW